MFFYMINVVLKETKELQEKPRGLHPSDDVVLEIAEITKKFNNEKMKDGYIFCSRIRGKKVDFSLVSKIKVEAEIIANDFIKDLDMEGKITCVREITLAEFDGSVESASRRELLEDADQIMGDLHLNALIGRRSFGENMIAEMDKEQLFAQAEKYLMKKSLHKEFTRIFQTDTSDFIGHPVHYLIQVDDVDTRREVTRLLLAALKRKNRIQSKRYCFTDFNTDERMMSPVQLRELYESCIGGTIVIRMNLEVMDSGDEAGYEHEIINAVCNCMNEYRHKVLTILCLPVEATRIKNLFYEKMGTLTLVELISDKVKDDDAKGFLQELAKESGTKWDKKLLNKIENGESYTASELRDIFDSWFDSKIKQSNFKQYIELESNNKKYFKEKNKGTAYDRLQKMVGLTDAKKVIDQALAYNKFQKLYAEQSEKGKRLSMHMVFTGNPGTAKTSVARLVAAIFRENEILSSGHLVEVGRSELVGAYVGWTAKIVKRKFEQAIGGVLFIDEAYSLVDDRKGSFGDEAINTIVQEMENHRDDVVVILAGYQNEMEHFLDTNPGLRSRIAFHVPFADYNADELTQIAELLAKEQKMKLSTTAIERIHEISENACKQNSFGNGRYMRNLMERATMAHAQRIINLGEIEHSKKLLTTLEAEDFEEIQLSHVEKKSIGFAG